MGFVRPGLLKSPQDPSAVLPQCGRQEELKAALMMFAFPNCGGIQRTIEKMLSDGITVSLSLGLLGHDSLLRPCGSCSCVYRSVI